MTPQSQTWESYLQHLVLGELYGVIGNRDLAIKLISSLLLPSIFSAVGLTVGEVELKSPCPGQPHSPRGRCDHVTPHTVALITGGLHLGDQPTNPALRQQIKCCP